MPPVLEAHNVQKQFGAITALSAGSLVVQQGEIHALLGANGCGKSTLCKIIAGAMTHDGGTLRLFGQEGRLKNPGEAEALGVALFYQELSLIPQLSIADNIFLGHERVARSGFLDNKQLYADTEALIARFAGVAGQSFEADRPVEQLTPDQRQIVEILKVLARRPRLIIFDEATATLDRRQVALFFEILRDLKNKDVSSIFISHRMDEIFAVADRITVMRNGATVASHATGDANREMVVRAMVGDLPVHDRIKREPEDATPCLELCGTGNDRLQNVSFMLKRGEILGLGGLQGQGQSSLLQGLFGALPFLTGTVTLDGRRISLRAPTQAIRQGFAYISGDRGQDAVLHGRSIFENIASATMVREKLRLIWPRRLLSRFEAAAAALNTRYTGMAAPIDSLSGGNQQKIFIARWLATNAQVLLLDDPTKGIDLAAKADFFALVRALTNEGASILFYASEDAELLNLCDRILVFNSGRISGELSGETLSAFHLAKAAYGEEA